MTKEVQIMLTLRGIPFGNVLVASGTLNFFGQGWWYHWYFKLLFGRRFDFSGAILIAKTTPLYERAGNMELKPNLQPKKLFPDCVKVFPRKGVALNAVGLSSPGLIDLLARDKWQKLTESFFLSFMAVGRTFDERVREAEKFVLTLGKNLPNFQAPVGIEINISCPNVNHNPRELEDDALMLLERLTVLGVPLMVKVNVLVETDSARKIADSGLCDALSLSNTVPWEQLPDRINWKQLFGTERSPLAKYGGGGLSGWPLVELVTERVNEFRSQGIELPILAGGGIGCHKQYLEDIQRFRNAGADALSIGSVALISPWNVSDCVAFGNAIFQEVER